MKKKTLTTIILIVALAMVAAFTAAARYMHMLVNIARRGNKAPAVYRLLYQPFRHVYVRGDLYYVPAAYQYVLHVRRLVIRPNVFQ